LKDFWFLLEDCFEDYISRWWNIRKARKPSPWLFFNFHDSFFCLKIIFFNVNGKAMVWHTPLFFQFCMVYLQSCYYSPIKLFFRDFPKTLWKVLACHPNKCQDWTQIFFHVPLILNMFSSGSQWVLIVFPICSSLFLLRSPTYSQ
jgi:hypothetical protein